MLAPFRVSQGTRAATLHSEIALFRLVVVVRNRIHLHFIIVLVVDEISVVGTQPSVKNLIIFLRVVTVIARISPVRGLHGIFVKCDC